MDELIKDWFEWCRDNRDKNTTALTSLYTWILHKACELNYPDSFGLPSQDAMHHLATSYNTYKKHLLLLEEIGMIDIVKKAQNQYTANVIALSNFDKALTKQVQITSQSNDKASINHLTKQEQSVNKASQYNIYNNNNSNNNILYKAFDHLEITNEEFNKLKEKGFSVEDIDSILEDIELYKHRDAKKYAKYKSLYATAFNWLKRNKENAKNNNTGAKPNTPIDYKMKQHLEHDKNIRNQVKNHKKPFVYGSQMNQFKKDN